MPAFSRFAAMTHSPQLGLLLQTDANPLYEAAPHRIFGQNTATAVLWGYTWRLLQYFAQHMTSQYLGNLNRPPVLLLLLLQNDATPLHQAARNGHAEVVGQLLGAGAAVDTAPKVGSPLLPWVAAAWGTGMG
jgi:hypothetical protein